MILDMGVERRCTSTFVCPMNEHALRRGCIRRQDEHFFSAMLQQALDAFERFGARSDILGSDIRLDVGAFRVIGVMPENFGFPTRDIDAYVPFAFDPVSVVVVAGSALLICFLATIYPSRQAARLDPAEALRHG